MPDAGMANKEGPQVTDFSDGAGNGLLIATNRVFLMANQATATGGTGPDIACKVLYRIVEVSLPEYIGLVQQQTAN